MTPNISNTLSTLSIEKGKELTILYHGVVDYKIAILTT